MSDTFREVSTTSWFGRIKRAVSGIAVGALLIAAMVFLLFWNEGRAVQTARSLAEGAGAVVSVGAQAVDPANEGRLIHVSGPLAAASAPSDADFGISTQGVRLVRTVEMYQWKETARTETQTKLGGGEETVTTYSYAKEWSEQAIDSSGFRQPQGHANPPKEIRSRRVQIPEATVGAFMLDTPVLDRIHGERALSVVQEQRATVEHAYGGAEKVSVVDGRIYLGWDPTAPAVGDYRISYTYAPLGTVSIIGRQAGDRFEPYQTVAGNQLLMVDVGNVPADQMFADAVSQNTVITWLLRAVGLVILIVGFALLLAPLGVLADIVPFLGSIVRMGTGFIAAALGLTVGTITIAVAWFWYRPLLAIAIIAAGLLLAFAVLSLGRRKRAGSVAAPVPAPAPTPTPAEAAPVAPRPGSKWN